MKEDMKEGFQIFHILCKLQMLFHSDKRYDIIVPWKYCRSRRQKQCTGN